MPKMFSHFLKMFSMLCLFTAISSSGYCDDVKIKDLTFKTHKEFAQAVYPHAVDASKKIGVDPRVLVAQAAHESNWGKNLPCDSDGRSSFNLFGMKAQSSGKNGVASKTTEYLGGERKRLRSFFRAYNNFNESFMDYARVICTAKRYEPAVSKASDPHLYLKSLQKAGYATDPHYAKKIFDIFKSPTIQQLA